jgi:hypothetical protein
MSSQKIEKILEKYFHGETSLTEERTLREFFRQEELPPHLAELKDQFSMLDPESEASLPDDFDNALFAEINNQDRKSKASKRAVLYYISGVAATILIIVTVFIRFDPFVGNQTKSQEELAFEEASRILYYVSTKFNQGADPLKKVARFDEGINNLNSIKKFDDGVSKTSPISRFKQITDLITNPVP